MPTPAYLSLEGERQGPISSDAFTMDSVGNIYQEGFEDICEEGWKDLWRHPFGYGITFGPKGERLINY
jgi:hypothetical protein